MSVSLPSREIYAVDVPEITSFTGKFNYNFFTPDESVSDTGGVPTKILERKSDAIDSAFIQYSATRAPRSVVFNFKLPTLADPGNQVSDMKQRNLVFSSNAQNGSLIADNIANVITEDQFSSNNFIAVNFHDGEIDDKIHVFVSSSYAFQTMGQSNDSDVSHQKAASKLSMLTPKYIKPHFLFKSMTLSSKAHGSRYFNKGGQEIFESYFDKLKNVGINAQINSKLFHDITNRAIKNPSSPFTTDMQNMHQFSKQLKHQVAPASSVQVSEEDYKTFVPFIDLRVRRSLHPDHQGPEIVGYIIDKAEILGPGKSLVLDPIIIDNPRVNLTADFQVRYNVNYVYAIRTVALFNVPAIDDDTGEIAMVKVLISSKPSSSVYVKTVENVAPPPPTDLNFTWNYERINPTTAKHDQTSGLPLPGTGEPGSLLVHWTFPPNSQRDIKRFQVFRRNDVDHPFELIKQFNFDDSVVRFPDNENPRPDLVEFLKSPCSFVYDDDFQAGAHHFHDPNQPGNSKTDVWSSTFIYAVAAIDAHGLTSNYSAQYQVWFDPFKNVLQKKLISHAGAPKPYPNLFLEADAFVDTIRVSGPHSKQMKVIFNPEYYMLYDDQNNLQRVLATKQTGGSYKFQFINTDNQKSAVVEVAINDQVRIASKTLAFPETRFGGRRRASTKKVITQ